MTTILNDPMIPQLYKIQEVYPETTDTFTWHLQSMDGSKCMFAPGQFNMLYIFGIGEVPISISGDPANQDVFIHTIRAVGTTTKAMASMSRGSVVGLRGPFGSPWPIDKAQNHDVIIVSGGIGLAPLRPALYHIFSHRDQYQKVVLLNGARTPKDLLFASELYEWHQQPSIDIKITVDAATRGWHGQVGVVTALIPQTQFDPPNTIAMVCGPEVMIRFTIRDLQNRGLLAENIYVSMERNMKCAIGLCGHCQYGSTFICKDGAVFNLPQIAQWFGKREI